MKTKETENCLRLEYPKFHLHISSYLKNVLSSYFKPKIEKKRNKTTK